MRDMEVKYSKYMSLWLLLDCFFCVMSWVMLLSKKKGIVREIEKEMEMCFCSAK